MHYTKSREIVFYISFDFVVRFDSDMFLVGFVRFTYLFEQHMYCIYYHYEVNWSPFVSMILNKGSPDLLPIVNEG